ncbi:MAG: hypothetical protein EBS96_09645 [Spartobacteria bacterium]|nr:hypothetical protein [Spartobacteria bacterium]
MSDSLRPLCPLIHFVHSFGVAFRQSISLWSIVVNSAESGLQALSPTHSFDRALAQKSPHHTCCEKAPTNGIIHLL